MFTVQHGGLRPEQRVQGHASLGRQERQVLPVLHRAVSRPHLRTRIQAIGRWSHGRCGGADVTADAGYLLDAATLTVPLRPLCVLSLHVASEHYVPKTG